VPSLRPPVVRLTFPGSMALALVTLGCANRPDPPAAEEISPAPSRAPVAMPSALIPIAATPDPPPLPPAEESMMVESDAGRVSAAQASRVLHVGDSMVPLVGNYLRPLFWREGRDYQIESIASSSTLDWGGDKRLLREAMYKYRPDLVLISLGSNELFDPTPARRAGAIRQVVADTRGRACLWIGPPAWKKDLGFIDVLKQNLGHCRYFDSTELELPRMADGRHPDWTGGHAWATAVWRVLGGAGPVPSGNRRPE
jgi:hypothetical protein